MAMRLAALLAVALALLTLSGCGGGASAGSTATHAEAGGEKSIEEFGSEAEGSDRSTLLASFHSYLGALAAREYAIACHHLSTNVQRSLEQLLTKAKKGVGCPRVLPVLLARTAATIAREQDEGEITKVRVQGRRAFVVFHAPGARLYQLTMARESGRWKAATAIASILVPSAATLGQ
jgi:hypothetical protein